MAVENSLIQYALRVITNNTVDVPDVGLYNGELRFITGRNTTGLTFEGGAAAADFLTGYLIEEPIKSVGAKIDISTGGNYNTLNSCTVTLDNTTQLATNLLANEVYLINSEIHIYVVIDDVMYPRFGGVLNDIRYNEKNVVFECKDVNELNFKQIPENDSEIVTVGNIPYVKLKKQLEGDKIEFNSFYGKRYYQTTYDGKSYPAVELAVSPEFAQKYGRTVGRLAGMYIRPRKSSEVATQDYSEAIKILSSSIAFGTSDKTVSIEVIIEYNFEDIVSSNMVGEGAFTTANTLANSPTLYNLKDNPDRYLFDIISFQTRYYVSSNEVEAIELDDDGKPIVYKYDSEKDDGVQNPWIQIDASVSYNDAGETPYVVLVNNTSDINIKTYKKVTFDTCSYKRHDIPPTTPSGGTYLDDGTRVSVASGEIEYTQFKINNAPFLTSRKFIDGDYTEAGIEQSDGKPWTLKCKKSADYADPDIFTVLNGVMLDLKLPDDFNYEDWDSVYLGYGIDMSNELLGSSTTAKEVKFYFDTLEAVYNYTTVGAGTLEKNFILPPSNRLTMDLLLYDTDTTTSYATQLYKDATYASANDSFAKIIFSPFMSDNASITQGKQIFGPSYILGTDPELSYANAYVTLEQDLKGNMKLENNFVSLDPDGYKHMYLFPRIDVFDYNETDKLYDTYRLGYRIYDVHLICEKNISSDTLYVKVKGEKLQGENIQVDNVYNTFRLMLEDYNNFTGIEYTNVATNRVDWDCSRVIDRPQSSKDLIKNLAQQSFVGIYTNREGNIELDAFFDDVDFDEDGNAFWSASSNPAKTTWVHDNNTIIDGSIKSVKSTNVSKIYNDINLNYSKNYATGDFAKHYYLTKVDAVGFAKTTIARTFDNLVTPSSLVAGRWCTDTSDPASATKIYINVLNSSFINEKDSVLKLKQLGDLRIEKDANTYYEFILDSDPVLDVSGFIMSADVAVVESGTVAVGYLDDTTVFLPDDYTDYTNIPSYTDAKAFWENSHLTWEKNKVVNNLPSQLANCEWYRDLTEFSSDANGVLNSSVHFYMEKLVMWVTKAKNMIKYSIPLNEVNIKIELLDRITFTDKLITDNSAILGWVTEVSVDPKKSTIDLEITTVPAELVPIYRIIDEKPVNVDGLIDEQPTPDGSIDEDFVMWE